MKRHRVVFLVALLAPASAAAQPKDQAAARAHFDKGEAHFKAGEYREAIDEYQATYDILEAPILLFDIGLCHQKLGNRQKAVELYRRYLVAKPSGKKSVEARARLATLESELAKAEKERKEAAAAELAKRRGEVERLRSSGPPADLARALADLAELDRDPELLFELAEAERRAGQRDAAIRAYNRYLGQEDIRHAEEARRRRGELERPPAREKTPPEKPPIAGGQKTALPPQHEPERPSLLPPLAASGAAAVALTAGLVFGKSARDTQSELEDQLENLQPPLDSGDTRIDDGRRAALYADVSFGVGAAAAVAAGYLWWRYLRGSGGDGGEAPRAMVVPRRRGAGIEVRW